MIPKIGLTKIRARKTSHFSVMIGRVIIDILSQFLLLCCYSYLCSAAQTKKAILNLNKLMDLELNGLNLDKSILYKIYYENPRKFLKSD
jgi:hypothetical protein